MEAGKPRTYLEVKRSKVKVTGSQSVKALLLAAVTRYVRMRKEDFGTSTLNSHAAPPWLFLYTPSYHNLACYVTPVRRHPGAR